MSASWNPPQFSTFYKAHCCLCLNENSKKNDHVSWLGSCEAQRLQLYADRRFMMKTLISLFGTLLISFPLHAQTTNYSLGSGNQPSAISAPLSGQTPNATAPNTSPVTGAPVYDPGNTAAIPPATMNSSSAVYSTGAETSGAGPGIGTTTTTSTGIGTGTGPALGTGAGGTGPTSTNPVPVAPSPLNAPTSPIPPATGTTQPNGSSMTPPGATGTGWQGI
jgi:hypothetical protein